MEYKFSAENKQKTISFLHEYIELCLKHKAVVMGIIGAETTLFQYFKGVHSSYNVKDEVEGNVREIISNLYDDSGNRRISREDDAYIYDAVKDLLQARFAQLYNPRSGHYVKIDRQEGGIVSHKKTAGPYKNIPIIEKCKEGKR